MILAFSNRESAQPDLEARARTLFGDNTRFQFLQVPTEDHYNDFIAAERIVFFHHEGSGIPVSESIARFKAAFSDQLVAGKRLFFYVFREIRQFDKTVYEEVLRLLPSTERLFYVRISEEQDYSAVLLHAAFYDSLQIQAIPSTFSSYLGLGSLVHATPALDRLLANLTGEKLGDFLIRVDPGIASGTWFREVFRKYYERIKSYTPSAKAAAIGLGGDIQLLDLLSKARDKDWVQYDKRTWAGKEIREKLDTLVGIADAVKQVDDSNFSIVEALIFNILAKKHSSYDLTGNYSPIISRRKSLVWNTFRELIAGDGTRTLDELEMYIDILLLHPEKAVIFDQGLDRMLEELRDFYGTIEKTMYLQWSGSGPAAAITEKNLSPGDLSCIAHDFADMFSNDSYTTIIDSSIALIEVFLAFHHQVFDTVRENIAQLREKAKKYFPYWLVMPFALRKQMKKLQIDEFIQGVFLHRILERLRGAWNEKTYRFFRDTATCCEGLLEVISTKRDEKRLSKEGFLSANAKALDTLVSGSIYGTFDRYLQDKLGNDLDASGIIAIFQKWLKLEISKHGIFEIDIDKFFKSIIDSTSENRQSVIRGSEIVCRHEQNCSDFLQKHPVGKQNISLAREFTASLFPDVQRELMTHINLIQYPFLLADDSIPPDETMLPGPVRDITAAYPAGDLSLPRILAGVEIAGIDPAVNLP